jgi:hypothetical protein
VHPAAINRHDLCHGGDAGTIIHLESGAPCASAHGEMLRQKGIPICSRGAPIPDLFPHDEDRESSGCDLVSGRMLTYHGDPFDLKDHGLYTLWHQYFLHRWGSRVVPGYDLDSDVLVYRSAQ